MTEPQKPSQWNCPQCGHEMVTSGVDMESFQQICAERDAALDDAEYWSLVADGIKHSHVCPNSCFCSAADAEHRTVCNRCRAEQLDRLVAQLRSLPRYECYPVSGMRPHQGILATPYVAWADLERLLAELEGQP